jgi:hypothetical protein
MALVKRLISFCITIADELWRNIIFQGSWLIKYQSIFWPDPAFRCRLFPQKYDLSNRELHRAEGRRWETVASSLGVHFFAIEELRTTSFHVDKHKPIPMRLYLKILELRVFVPNLGGSNASENFFVQLQNTAHHANASNNAVHKTKLQILISNRLNRDYATIV